MDTTTRTRPAPALARLTELDGLHHLLVRASDGLEQVATYNRSEMDELFSAAEQARLALGEPVEQTSRWHGRMLWVDMVAAARGVAA